MLRRDGLCWVKVVVLTFGVSMSGVIPLLADTDVVFNGRLVADPCQVELESQSQTVEFSPIVARHFSNNEESYPVQFFIKLLECDLSLGSQISVTFIGDQDLLKPDFFALDGTTEGLALSIKDSNGKQVIPGVRQETIALNGIENTLSWQARLTSTAGYGGVTEGEYIAVVTFQLEYE